MSVKWSYSSMSLFQQCPKKYYHLRVIKDIKDPPSDQLRYGLQVHKAAEEYVRDDVPIPAPFIYMKDALDKLKATTGVVYCEHKMGLTQDLRPCKFEDADAWWRGIADLLVVDGSVARIVDYKTGKNTYPDTQQLELLSLATFKHFPEVKVVKAGLLFMVHPSLVKETYREEEQTERWKKWIQKSEELESSMLYNVWNPKQNFTCRSWCPVLACAHNGRSNWD